MTHFIMAQCHNTGTWPRNKKTQIRKKVFVQPQARERAGQEATPSRHHKSIMHGRTLYPYLSELLHGHFTKKRLLESFPWKNLEMCVVQN